MPYTPFWALQDVNVDIMQGETFGILGRNGCGKSTLLKCIAGILKPTSGEIRVAGQPGRHARARRRLPARPVGP